MILASENILPLKTSKFSYSSRVLFNVVNSEQSNVMNKNSRTYYTPVIQYIGTMNNAYSNSVAISI